MQPSFTDKKLLFSPVRILLIAAVFAACISGFNSEMEDYNCDRSGKTVVIHDEMFNLKITYEGNKYIESDMDCKFRISDPNNTAGSMYMIQIISSFSHSVEESLTITDGNRTLMQDPLSLEQIVSVTRTSSVFVHYFTRSISSPKLGQHIRFTRFVGCPPGWSSISNICIGPSSSNPVIERCTYRTSQGICNSMRSNLLTLPLLASAGIRSVKEMAERIRFRHPVWIGLTDNTTQGPGSFYWLDGTPQYIDSTNWIRCDPNEAWSAGGCSDNKHFAYLWLTAKPLLFMDRNLSLHYFACAMPRGGTDVFFQIPWRESPPKFPLTTLLALIPFCILLLVVLFCCLRRYRPRRSLAIDNAYQPIDPDSKPRGYFFAIFSRA